MISSVQEYYAAIRTLEEFGPESTKSTAAVTLENDSKLDPLEDSNENSQVERTNGSQKTSK